MWSNVRSSTRTDDGIALITALFAIVVLGGLAVLFVARAVSESQFSRNSRDFEQALHVAEAGPDLLLGIIEGEVEDRTEQFITEDSDGNQHRFDVSTTEREWVIGVAEADPDGLIETTEGQAYAIRPYEIADDDGDGVSGRHALPVVYGVGFVPSMDAADRKVRIVRMRIERDEFNPRNAIETAGDLNIGGNASITAPDCDFDDPDPAECNADVKVNGDLNTTGGSHSIEGDVKVAGSGGCPGSINSTGSCTDSDDGVEEADVPESSARDYYELQEDNYTTDPATGAQVDWYDLCVDSTGSASLRLKDPDDSQPCTGDLYWPDPDEPASTTSRGWSYQSGTNTWNATDVQPGVYYVYQADAKVNGTAGTGQRSVTIFVETNDANPGGSGSLTLSGNPSMVAAFPNVLFVTDRDLKMKGTAGGGSRDVTCADDPATPVDESEECDVQNYTGFISVGEQIDVSGTVELTGAMVVQDREDLHGLVRRNNDGVTGTMVLDYDENLNVVLSGRYIIRFWNELTPGNPNG